MSGAAMELHAGAARAEALTARLGFLSAAMLGALEQDGYEAVYAFLTEHQQVQAETEPLLTTLRGSAPGGDPSCSPSAAIPASAWVRIEENLRQAQHSHRAVETRLARACADLREQLRTQRRRSSAVLAYESAAELAGSGFSRVG
jgi:hypothetical protein